MLWSLRRMPLETPFSQFNFFIRTSMNVDIVYCTGWKSDKNTSVVFNLCWVKVAVSSMFNSKGYGGGGGTKSVSWQQLFSSYLKKNMPNEREWWESEAEISRKERNKKKAVKHQIRMVRDISKGRYLLRWHTQACYKDPFTTFTFIGVFLLFDFSGLYCEQTRETASCGCHSPINL